MKNGLASPSFVEAAGRIFVIRHQPREVAVPDQLRLDHGPGFKLHSDSALTVNIRHSLDDVPESLRIHAVQQHQHRLPLIDSPGVKRLCVRRRAPQPSELPLQEFACRYIQVFPSDLTHLRRQVYPFRETSRSSVARTSSATS